MMKTFLLAIAFAAVLCAQSTTTVSDTIRDGRNRLVSGVIMLEWDDFVNASGSTIGGGRTFVPVVGGSFTVGLIPTDTGSPTGRTYSAYYALKGGYRRNPENWHICTTSGTLRISDAVSNTCPGGGSGDPAVLSWAALTSSDWAALTSSSWAALTN